MQQAATLNNLFNQARQAYAAGRHEEALRHASHLVSLGGAREEALNLQAMSLLGLGRAREAGIVMGRALKKNPRSAGLHLNAARIDLVLADRRSAKRHALEAARLDQRDARVLYQAAVACRQCGDYAQALKLTKRCQALAPELAEAWHLEGSMLMDQGEQEAAASALSLALEKAPGHARALADLTRLRGDDAGVLQGDLERVTQSGRTAWDRSAAGFALADLMHRTARFDEAAAHYRAANQLGASVRPFNLDAWEQKQTVTLRSWAELAPQGSPGMGDGANLVFLVGMPRSGTSLCEQVIGAHPDALPCGELTTMHAIELHSADDLTDDQKRRRYLDGLPPEHAGKTLVTDKLPMNFERVGLIHRLFPGARFIHCRRHPLDTVLSCYQQDFQAGVKWAFDLDSIARVFIAQQRLMAFWAERLPEHILAVDYEDMVTDLPGQVGRLTEFLGIHAHPDMLAPHRSERTVQTASRLQVREAVYTTSVEKWRPYEALLAPATHRLRDAGMLGEDATS